MFQIPPEDIAAYAKLWPDWGSGLMFVVAILAILLVLRLIYKLILDSRGPVRWHCRHCGSEIHEHDSGIFYPDGRVYCSNPCERHEGWLTR